MKPTEGACLLLYVHSHGYMDRGDIMIRLDEGEHNCEVSHFISTIFSQTKQALVRWLATTMSILSVVVTSNVSNSVLLSGL